METIQVGLNKNLAEAAAQYAHQAGTDLSSMLEAYLLRIVSVSKKGETHVPDVVQSLLGAGESLSDDDINGRKAMYSHLEQKYL